MASIKQSKKAATYTALRSATAEHNESNDCAVIAIAATTGSTYAEAHKALRLAGRTARKGVLRSQIFEALSLLGYAAVSKRSCEFIMRYPSSHQILKNVTTHHPERFNKVWADGSNYLLFTKGHVAGVVNGVNADWTKGRANRVIGIFEVIRNGNGMNDIMLTER